MWHQALFVEFCKFTHYANAIEIVNVPCDCLDEANGLWGNWSMREQFEEYPG